MGLAHFRALIVALLFCAPLAAHEIGTTRVHVSFRREGTYTIRIAAPGYKEQMFVVTAAENAQQEVAAITAKLEKQ